MSCLFFFFILRTSLVKQRLNSSGIGVAKQRDVSGGELADTMKSGEGTGVEGERELAVFRVVGGVFRGGPVDKCLVSGCKSWKVVLQSDVYEKRWREGNVNRIINTPTHQVHSGSVHLRHTYAYGTPYHTQIHTQKKKINTHKECNFVHYVGPLFQATYFLIRLGGSGGGGVGVVPDRTDPGFEFAVVSSFIRIRLWVRVFFYPRNTIACSSLSLGLVTENFQPFGVWMWIDVE